MKNTFTHMDYRNAKVIHLVNNNEERFIYKNQTISKKEAMQLVLQFQIQKENKSRKKRRVIYDEIN